MKLRLPLGKAIAATLSVFVFAVCEQTLASPVSLLGEQDFADGAIVATDSAWLVAQANETLPTTAIYSSPGVISYLHSGLDSGLPGLLTFSLWDLDSGSAGNQVVDFRLDNIPQPISAFETGEPHLSIKIFQFPVDQSLLADGAVQVLIQLGTPTGNNVGLDFSRLELVPEPSALALLMVSLPFATQLAHRRSSRLS